MHRRQMAFVVAILVVLGSAAASAETPPAVTLSVERSAEINRLWVERLVEDRGVERRLLRETPSPIAPGTAGADPAGRAFFATWTEGAGEPWFSVSRDGGARWTEAERLRTELRLHDGAVSPGSPLPGIRAGLSLPPDGRLFIVQFRTISLPEWRQTLLEEGAEILAVFPHNGHIVRMAPAMAARIADLEFVGRVEPYHPSFRLETELLDWLSGAGPAAGEMRVRAMAFEWGPDGKARIARAAEAAGARIADSWPSGHIVELWVDRAQLGRLAAHDDVMWIDRWSEPETDMDLVREDSGANWLETNHNQCGQGVRGEVMDNGIQQNHMDFDGILMHTSADLQSHGTNTYGIVFGNGNRDGDGQAKATGLVVCSGSQGIFADYGVVSDRFAHTQELKNSPYFASFQTNSWGDARTRSYTSASHQMDDIIWRLDIAITQSQSNAGNQDSRPQAWAKNIISVGGVRHYDTLSSGDDCWCSGASIGPAADGRIKPDLAYWYDNIYTTTTGNGYTSTFGGTSAATPEVAGVLGLVVQMWSDNVWGTNPVGGTVFERQPHFATIKALLINNAVQWPFSGTNHDLTRMHQGWGRPNSQTARQRAARSFVVDQTEPLTLGAIAAYDIEVLAGESDLKVTMAYPDPPGTTSSTLHRINNLDLKVVSPSGTTYHGNVGLDAARTSSPGGSPNNVDTVENVFVANPAAGLWRVEVRAAEINQDAHTDTPQADATFALVVTGAALQASNCGNGVREPGESCDGADLGGQTCTSRGCGGGTLGCTPQCTFDLSACTGCPSCDNDGVCEPFEDCNNCANDCRSGGGAVCPNAVCETADGENCVTCPQDCNGVQSGKPANRYCCGNGGTNPVGCDPNLCTGNGNVCTTTAAPASCCGDGTCTGDESSSNCEIDCGPPPSCGDGTCSAGEDSCSCPQDCGSPPASELVGSTCTDGLDNDCDGAIDCLDSDCSGDPLCACGQAGASCTQDLDCCSNKCRGPSGGKTCR